MSNITRTSMLSLCVLSTGADFASADDLEGRLDPNCDSALVVSEMEGKPGILQTHGVDFHFYPASVPDNFTGCQVVWLENGHRLMTTHYSLGKVTWIKGQEPKEVRPYFCRYKDETLVESESFNIKRCPKTPGEMR
jgi:hypothetical protein